MRMAAKGLRHALFEQRLDLLDRLPFGQPGAVGNAEDMGIDREGFRAKGAVHHHIGGLAPDTGKGSQDIAIGGNFAAKITQQDFGQGDDVLRLGIEQADGADVLLEAILAEIEHLLRRLHRFEQGAGRLVDTDVGRLRGKHHGDQQLVGVAIGEFRLGSGIGLGETAEEFEDLVFFQSRSNQSDWILTCSIISVCTPRL